MSTVNKELMQMVLKASAEDSNITIEDLKKFVEEHEKPKQPVKTTRYYDDEKTRIECEKWELDGKLHREDGPAFTDYFGNGKICNNFYYIHGKLHREDGPAKIQYQYHTNGKIQRESYFINGKQHREDGKPSQIVYSEDGCIVNEKYYINGKLHRTDGPAEIEYNKDGQIVNETYYEDDKKIKETNYF